MTELGGKRYHLNNNNGEEDLLCCPEIARLRLHGTPEWLPCSVPEGPGVVALPDFTRQYHLRLTHRDTRTSRFDSVAFPDLHLLLAEERSRSKVDLNRAHISLQEKLLLLYPLVPQSQGVDLRQPGPGGPARFHVRDGPIESDLALRIVGRARIGPVPARPHAGQKPSKDEHAGR